MATFMLFIAALVVVCPLVAGDATVTLANQIPYKGTLTGGAVNTPCWAYFKYAPAPTDTIVTVQAIANINAMAQMTLWGDPTNTQPSYNTSKYKGVGTEFTREIQIHGTKIESEYYFAVEGGCQNTTYSITVHSRSGGPVPLGSGFVNIYDDPYNGIVLGFVMAQSSVKPCDKVIYELYARALSPDDAPSLVDANMTTLSGLQQYATILDDAAIIVDSSCGYVDAAVGHYGYNLYTLVVRDTEDPNPESGIYLMAVITDFDPGQQTTYVEILVLMYVWIPIMICCCVALICSVFRSRREDEWVSTQDLLDSYDEETPLGGHTGTGEPEADPGATELLPIRRNKKKKRGKRNATTTTTTTGGRYGAVPDSTPAQQV